jgi:hypothetical protein
MENVRFEVNLLYFFIVILWGVRVMPGCGLCPVLVGSVRVIRGGVHVGCVVINSHADVCFERSREVIVSGGGEWRERECGVMRGLRYVASRR